jgi:hypothetical protein
MVGVLFLVACVAAALLLTESYVVYPHGMWDAHVMWNARARVMYRAPYSWRNVFLPDNFHTDYPLSLSILVDTGWRAVERETPLVPFALAAAFLASAVAAVGLGVTLWKNLAWGLVAATLVLSSTAYIWIAGWQYADIPFSALLAASVVLITLAYREPEVNRPALVLAGAVAGLCAWIKNEGTPVVFGFTLGLALAGLLLRKERDWLRQLGFLWIGAAPVLAALQYYRSFAPVSEIITNAVGSGVLPKLEDAHRWGTILRRYGAALWSAPGAAVPLVLAAVFIWVVAGIRIEQRLRLPLLAGWCALLSVAAGHVAAYLVSPYNLDWHIGTSVTRLALQLVPSFVFLALLPVRADFFETDAAGEPAE